MDRAYELVYRIIKRYRDQGEVAHEGPTNPGENAQKSKKVDALAQEKISNAIP